MIKGLVNIIRNDIKKLSKMDMPEDAKEQIKNISKQLFQLLFLLEIESEKD